MSLFEKLKNKRYDLQEAPIDDKGNITPEPGEVEKSKKIVKKYVSKQKRIERKNIKSNTQQGDKLLQDINKRKSADLTRADAINRSMGTSGSTEGAAGAGGTATKTKTVKQSEVSQKAKDFTKKINKNRVKYDRSKILQEPEYYKQKYDQLATKRKEYGFTKDPKTKQFTPSKEGIKRYATKSAQLSSGSAISRGSQSLCEFAFYEGNKQYGKLYIADGTNKIGELVIEITNAGVHTYSFKEVKRSAPTDPELVTIFGERLIVAGYSENPQVVAYSTRLSPENFTGSSAGTVDVGDQIVGIKSFRNKLIIFCKNSIYQLSGLDTTAVLSSVTKNIGWVSGKTIQEIAREYKLLSDGYHQIVNEACLARLKSESPSL